jgi:hypothetical protein
MLQNTDPAWLLPVEFVKDDDICIDYSTSNRSNNSRQQQMETIAA